MSKFDEILNSWTAADDFLADKIESMKTKVDSAIINYGFHINGNESNPSNAITYLGDAIGMIPAKMNYSSGTFDYGSWQNAFFMPKPCMLKSDGTVAYYLNPNDYTKKTDGTASDVANDSFDGNAMMEWGQIWKMVLPDPLDSSSATVYISNVKLGEGYHAWSNIGLDGNLKEHFYTPIYSGSLISGKLRSLSGQTNMKSQTANAEITAAKANGDGWFTEVYGDVELINFLLVLMGKSLDTQTVYGTGNIKSGQAEANMLKTGAINQSDTASKGNQTGLFYGTNDQVSLVKVFGMENYWGNQWRRTAGMINDNGNIKVKRCYGTSDGSTVFSYGIPTDNTGTHYTGYVSSGVAPITASGSYISKMDFSIGSIVPKSVASSSSSTYYCDTLWTNNSQVNYLTRGGSCLNGAACGAFCLILNSAASGSRWDIGAALSFKSL